MIAFAFKGLAPRVEWTDLRLRAAGSNRASSCRYQVCEAPADAQPLTARSSCRGMIDFGDIALLAAIGFLGALIFGLTGFGSSLITIPLASHLVPLHFALALFALGDLVGSSASASKARSTRCAANGRASCR